MLQLGIFSLHLSRASRYAHDAATSVQQVADVFIAAAPTGVPTLVIMSAYRCVLELKRKDIMVQNTIKVKTAAAVEVVVFDKTGTLTSSVVRHLLTCLMLQTLCDTTTCMLTDADYTLVLLLTGHIVMKNVSCVPLAEHRTLGFPFVMLPVVRLIRHVACSHLVPCYS